MARSPWTARLLAVVSATLLVLAGAPAARAHEERPVAFPDGSGSVPVLRTGEPDLLVCKTDRAGFARRTARFPAPLRERNARLFARCLREGYRHVQQAVDAVDRPGMTIAILPGLYEEEPSLPPPAGACAALDAPRSSFGYQVLSYAQQRQCPHNQNLVAILGKKDLQIEGTGADRTDVVIDAKYRKLNAVRADGSDGVYFRNFTAQRTTFNSLYVLAADGFVIDDVLTRWNDEYGFLTFASDHGLYKNCESYGNGDSGIYPGSASDINDGRGYDVPRYSIEITGCRSHHNMVGYSGTAGDSVYVHDNEFDHNMGGASMDSAFPGHPGLPQNHARFARNDIHDNNQDYYRYVADGTCARPPAERGYEQGVVCPQISMPPGSGIITAGGNWNLYEDNWIHGHRRTAFYLSAVPAFVRGEGAWSKQADTSHRNRYAGNRLGVDKAGNPRPNRTDVWWDGQGTGNCWQPGTGSSTPRTLPTCGARRGEVSGGSHRLVGEPVKLVQLLVCADYDVQARRLPAGCDWYGARGIARVETQLALGAAAVLGLVGGVLWWRRLRPGRLAGAAAAAGAAGLALDVAGSTTGLTAGYVPALALVLLGAGWTGLGLALRRAGRRGLGGTTVALGVLTLLDAFDKAVLMIPWTPVSPAWLRTLLAVVWVLGAVAASAPGPGRGEAVERPGGVPDRDPAAGAAGGPGGERDAAPGAAGREVSPRAAVAPDGGAHTGGAAAGPDRELAPGAAAGPEGDRDRVPGAAAPDGDPHPARGVAPAPDREPARGAAPDRDPGGPRGPNGSPPPAGRAHRGPGRPARSAGRRPWSPAASPVVASAVAMAVAMAVVAGCGGPATTHHKPGTSHQEATGSTGTLLDAEDGTGHRLRQVPPEGAPAIRLTARPDSEDGWNVHLDVRDFRFTPQSAGGAALPGRGHARLLLDGRPVARVYGPWHHLPSSALPAGARTLTARLHADDHTAWAVHGKPVEATAVLGPAGEAPADRTLDITVTAGAVQPPTRRVEVERGERLALTVTSDRDDTLHVHGYDKEAPLRAGRPTTLTLTADRAGLFEVETHASGLVLVQLAVR